MPVLKTPGVTGGRGRTFESCRAHGSTKPFRGSATAFLGPLGSHSEAWFTRTGDGGSSRQIEPLEPCLICALCVPSVARPFR